MAGKTTDHAIEAEAFFLLIAARKGWAVAKPAFHAYPFDYVVREDNLWVTVQVKRAFMLKLKDGRKQLTVSIRRCNEKGSRPYHDGDFTTLFVTDCINYWWIPWVSIKNHHSTITLGKKWNEFKH